MKPLIKQLSLYLFFVFLSPPALVWSQAASRNEMLAQNNKETLERWQRMGPEEKQELRERFSVGRTCRRTKKRSCKKVEKLARSGAEEKAAARKNFERWQNDAGSTRAAQERCANGAITPGAPRRA